MTPADRQEIYSHRDIDAIIRGMGDDEEGDTPITGKSLGEAIVFVSEGAGTNASNAHVIYGDHGSLSYTDCLSVYRDFGASLRARE